MVSGRELKRLKAAFVFFFPRLNTIGLAGSWWGVGCRNTEEVGIGTRKGGGGEFGGGGVRVRRGKAVWVGITEGGSRGFGEVGFGHLLLRRRWVRLGAGWFGSVKELLVRFL